MSSQSAGLSAARAILDARIANAPAGLLPTTDDRHWTPQELRQRVLTRLDPIESARLQLLVAADAINNPTPSSTGKPWSGRFGHAMVQHFAVATAEATERDHEAAVIAAALALQKMLGWTKNGTSIARLQEIGVDWDNFAWQLELGMTETQYLQHVNTLTAFHKRASARQRDHAAVLRPDGPVSATIDSANLAPISRVLSTADEVRHFVSRPTWLRVGKPHGGPALATAVSWRLPDAPPTTDVGTLNDALAAAWDAFRAEDLAGADDRLGPLYAGFGTNWLPVDDTDGHILLNWMRFVRFVGAANDTARPGWRLAAISAVEMATRLSAAGIEASDLIDELVGRAMDDLPPSFERPLSQSFATYSARLIAALGHQRVFKILDYSNSDRAQARSAWERELPRLGLTANDSSADCALSLKKAYKEFRYRVAELTENYRLSNDLTDLLSKCRELFDSGEIALLDRGIGSLTDVLTIVRPDTTAKVTGIYELGNDLSSVASEVASSGSLLLQEALLPRTTRRSFTP